MRRFCESGGVDGVSSPRAGAEQLELASGSNVGHITKAGNMRTRLAL